MNLIIGGAYQGKLDWACEHYSLDRESIYTCEENTPEIDFSKTCINHLEEFILACIRADVDPLEYLKAHWEDWRDSIFICMDLSCGVVPLGKELRLWRNACGLVNQYLAKEACSVTRIFCGLEQKLK